MKKLSLGLMLITALLMSVTGLMAQAITINGFTVTYNGAVYNASADQTTFTYTVSGTNTPPDLSHFDVEIPTCDEALEVVAYTPDNAVEFGTDPTTGIDGIKWDLPLSTTSSRMYTLTFAGNISEGDVTVAVKGGNGFEAGTVPGASCTVADVTLVKSISADGGETWSDAEIEPGLLIDEPGTPIIFNLSVTNTGDFPLENIVLSDTGYDLSACSIPATLEVDATFDCEINGLEAVEGQNSNTATVTALANGQEISDTDSAFYYAGELPLISIEKALSLAGDSTWRSADEAPGYQTRVDASLEFQITVANDGNVDLTNIVLSDSMYDTSACEIPEVMAPGDVFTCNYGPLEVGEEGEYVNTATVTALAGEMELSATDSAYFYVADVETCDEDDDDCETPVVIIIEGPVEEINGNIIIIFGQEIVIDPDDPILAVISIGDFIRIEGETESEGNTIIVIAVTVVIVDVDIYINDTGEVYRDDNECSNPPPPWAPAHGWRAKCGVPFEGKSNTKIKIKVKIKK